MNSPAHVASCEHQANRARDTEPELAVRRRLHAAGLRYHVDVRPETSIRRRADVVFRGARVAVFIDGCYWHGCEEHAAIPRRNRDYWEPKIRRSMARDVDTTARLEEAGWTVLRFWEHEDPNDVAAMIASVVRQAG
ncbi:very short patch repair endonuclease [Bacillus subtilis]|uniref:very short patch repair endonuclease n=1 Tax=Bacillus subtilis TaxID=1423 RepID=UPI0035D8BCBF